MSTHHTQPGQARQILRHLEKGHTITPLAALKLYGCMRLGARIHELRDQGYDIQSEMVTIVTRGRKARVCRYRLAS